jgi:hypothetical protein
MKLLSRLGISAAAGIGVGVIAVVALAVMDLYLSGHGHGSITREIITWEPGGVHLSVADLALLLVVLLAAGLTWFFLQR